MPGEPKRHHHVPDAYLERFAAGGLVWVRWREGRTYSTDPTNAAVESGFYNIPDGEGGISTDVETFLARVEGPAMAVLGIIDRTGIPPAPGNPERSVLARYLAFQMHRTTQTREQALFAPRLTEWAAGRAVTRDVVAEYLEQVHLGYAPGEHEIDGAFAYVSMHLEDPTIMTPLFAIRTMLEVAVPHSALIADLHWSIEFDRRREFITSDVPVVLWRKPCPEDHIEGIGIQNMDELRFPLDSGKQLVMSNRERPSTADVAVHRVRRSNADLAAACHRFLVGSPNNCDVIASRRLDPRRPVLRFDVEPAYEPGPDGEPVRRPGRLIHMWLPRGSQYGPR